MILILSDNTDHSTNEVITWLHFHKQPFIRIHSEDVLSIDADSKGFSITVNDKKYYIADITSFWYRRGHLNIRQESRPFFEKDAYFIEKANWYRDYIYFLLESKTSINSHRDAFINKLKVNELAQRQGLQIPKTIITSRKSDLDPTRRYITKTANGLGIVSFSEDLKGLLFTELLDYNEIPEQFFPSYIQEYVAKKYELRIFYLHKQFRSMAIFSQKDKQTQIDFRHYNQQKPNRKVPFQLPAAIENKLTGLMESLSLNSGSIDMIVTPDNDYYFLEINPVGQFGMTSKPCNYNIEKEIADYLAHEQIQDKKIH